MDTSYYSLGPESTLSRANSPGGGALCSPYPHSIAHWPGLEALQSALNVHTLNPGLFSNSFAVLRLVVVHSDVAT